MTHDCVIESSFLTDAYKVTCECGFAWTCRDADEARTIVAKHQSGELGHPAPGPKQSE